MDRYVRVLKARIVGSLLYHHAQVRAAGAQRHRRTEQRNVEWSGLFMELNRSPVGEQYSGRK